MARHLGWHDAVIKLHNDWRARRGLPPLEPPKPDARVRGSAPWHWVRRS